MDKFVTITCVETGDEYTMQADTPYTAFKKFIDYLHTKDSSLKDGRIELVGNGNALAFYRGDKTYYCNMRS